MEDLKKGQILGDFRILEQIGSGGMGVIYKACYKTAENKVRAIKIIKPEFAGDANFIARFQQEEQLIVDLIHPHIVRGYHFGEADGLHYLVMDYIAGESLRARLARDKRLSVTETVRLFEQLSSALAYAHGKGVIHRDIKPDNILLRASDGAALLTDFGLMKAIGEQNFLNSLSYGKMNSRPTGSEAGQQSSEGGGGLKGSSPGTRAYMAPEQIRGGEITARTDIYQLGMVMYECLTGELAIGRFADPSRHNPEVSAALEKVIFKCLEADPAARYALSCELSEALKQPDVLAGRHASPRNKVKRWVLLLCCALACVAATHWSTKTLRPAVKPAPDPVQQPPAEPPEAAQIPVSQANSATPISETPTTPVINKQEEEAKKDTEESGRTKTEEESRLKKISGYISRGNKWLKAGKYRSAIAEFQAAVDRGAGDEAVKLLTEANKQLKKEEADKVEADFLNSGDASDCKDGTCNWYDAMAYCDGKLLTINELRSLYQDECTEGNHSDTCRNWYWSSDGRGASTIAAGVSFNDGGVGGYGKGGQHSVRCQ